MISVLTLTYQRHHLLEETIWSFLLQNNADDCEMVIINDSPDVKYTYGHPRIRIINLDERFESIGKKLQYGFNVCKNNFVYRLDDDDLLSPYAIELQKKYITENPGKDIYRCQHHYLFVNNKFEAISDSINNGNCYTKSYVNSIEFPNSSGDEDNTITYWRNANIYVGKENRYSMIYRWGMGTYHISGMGNYADNEYIKNRTDQLINKETGVIALNPNFINDYYSQLPSI